MDMKQKKIELGINSNCIQTETKSSLHESALGDYLTLSIFRFFFFHLLKSSNAANREAAVTVSTNNSKINGFCLYMNENIIEEEEEEKRNT